MSPINRFTCDDLQILTEQRTYFFRSKVTVEVSDTWVLIYYNTDSSDRKVLWIKAAQVDSLQYAPRTSARAGELIPVSTPAKSKSFWSK